MKAIDLRNDRIDERGPYKRKNGDIRSADEVGQMLGISRETVRQTCNSVRKKLRDALENDPAVMKAAWDAGVRF